MARNKITYDRDRDERLGLVHRFTGSVRQPTIIEANNYLNENHIEIYGIVVYAQGSGFGEYWLPPEDSKTLELFEYEVANGDPCPICGNEKDLGGSKCPICMRPWD